MNKKFYVTTPIYYVNDVPHVGHAYTTIAADVVARYHRLLEEDVFFLTGTDEHGAKVASAAKEAGKKPKEFCNQVVARFIDAWKNLNISNDYFIRTTHPRHEKIVQELLQKVYDRGFIYKGIYEGLYCVGCEKFLIETDLVDGRCPLHPNQKPVKQKEKNYFFKLSDFRIKLIKAIEDKTDPNYYEILPKERRNEVLGKLKQGLGDVSISRATVEWGIPIPWDKTQTVYVWIDALLNYYTATYLVENKLAPLVFSFGNKKNFWPPDLHLVGKDILWFHAVIWEAFLLAAGLPLPKMVFAHGFFTINGQKMSKSLGNVISPDDLIEKIGVDGARYLMLSEFPFGDDGDISLEKFKTRYNADLANGLGNLVARIAKLCELRKVKLNKILPRILLSSIQGRYREHLERYQFHLVLDELWRDIKKIDIDINNEKPWESNDAGKIANYARRLKHIAFALQPFLPQTAEKIAKQFAGPEIKSGPPLFPRLR